MDHHDAPLAIHKSHRARGHARTCHGHAGRRAVISWPARNVRKTSLAGPGSRSSRTFGHTLQYCSERPRRAAIPVAIACWRAPQASLTTGVCGCCAHPCADSRTLYKPRLPESACCPRCCGHDDRKPVTHWQRLRAPPGRACAHARVRMRACSPSPAAGSRAKRPAGVRTRVQTRWPAPPTPYTRTHTSRG